MEIGALHGDATICSSTENHDIPASFLLRMAEAGRREAGWDVCGVDRFHQLKLVANRESAEAD